MTTTSDPPPFLLVLDLETTGLDPMVDVILEIGMLVVPSADPDAPVLLQFDAPVQQAGDWQWRMDEVVTAMHTTSGLLDAIPQGLPLAMIEGWVIEALDGVGDPGDFLLTGSGVARHDRPFIAANMPRLNEWLVYYELDVGGLRRALRMAGVDFKDATPDKPHRALKDARIHLDEWRQYRALLQQIGRPAGWDGGSP